MEIIDKKITRSTGLTIEKEVEVVRQYLDYLVESINDYGELSSRKTNSKEKEALTVSETVDALREKLNDISEECEALQSYLPISGEGLPQDSDNMVQGQIYIDELTGSAYICISDDEATGRQYAKITQ